jgi:hypothetical protein
MIDRIGWMSMPVGSAKIGRSDRCGYVVIERLVRLVSAHERDPVKKPIHSTLSQPMTCRFIGQTVTDLRTKFRQAPQDPGPAELFEAMIDGGREPILLA